MILSELLNECAKFPHTNIVLRRTSWSRNEFVGARTYDDGIGLMKTHIRNGEDYQSIFQPTEEELGADDWQKMPMINFFLDVYCKNLRHMMRPSRTR